MEVPDGICGFELSPEDLDRDGYLSQEELRQKVGTATCWRETWRDHERCIWHADVVEKPAGEIVEARRNGWDKGSALAGSEIEESETLDGAVLNAVKFGDDIDFSRCALHGAELNEADLSEATLQDADLRGAELHDANLRGAELHDAYLVDAELHDAYLSNGNLEQADLGDAEIHWSNLENADLTRANLDGTTFGDVRLYKTRLQDVFLSDQTTFQERCWYDYRADPIDVPESVLLQPLDELEWNVLSPDLESVRITDDDHNIEVSPPEETRTGDVKSLFTRWLALFKTNDGDESDRVDNYETARSVYRTRERIHRENSLPEDVGPEYVKAKWTQHRKALAENDWRSYIDLALRRWSMKYGEGPWRLVYASIAVIFGFGLLYPLFGGVQLSRASGPVIDLVSPLDLSLATEPLNGLLASLYFSAVTFTTLGYGDIQPNGVGAQLFAGMESFLGAIMIALFVAVVARNKMR